MATEDGEQGSGVIMTVSGRGQTVRPVTVSLVTFDLTATGIKSLLSNFTNTHCVATYHLQNHTRGVLDYFPSKIYKIMSQGILLVTDTYSSVKSIFSPYYNDFMLQLVKTMSQ